MVGSYCRLSATSRTQFGPKLVPRVRSPPVVSFVLPIPLDAEQEQRGPATGCRVVRAHACEGALNCYRSKVDCVTGCARSARRQGPRRRLNATVAAEDRAWGAVSRGLRPASVRRSPSRSPCPRAPGARTAGVRNPAADGDPAVGAERASVGDLDGVHPCEVEDQPRRRRRRCPTRLAAAAHGERQPLSRAKSTAAITSATSAHRAISTGRRSIMPFYTARASS